MVVFTVQGRSVGLKGSWDDFGGSREGPWRQLGGFQWQQGRPLRWMERSNVAYVGQLEGHNGQLEAQLDKFEAQLSQLAAQITKMSQFKAQRSYCEAQMSQLKAHMSQGFHLNLLLAHLSL